MLEVIKSTPTNDLQLKLFMQLSRKLKIPSYAGRKLDAYEPQRFEVSCFFNCIKSID